VPLLNRFQALGNSVDQLVPLLRNFNATAPAFQQAAASLSDNSPSSGDAR
jgi:hypothetical protein